MPEPTYVWLIENKLIENDGEKLRTSPKGLDLLKKYRDRLTAIK